MNLQIGDRVRWNTRAGPKIGVVKSTDFGLNNRGQYVQWVNVMTGKNTVKMTERNLKMMGMTQE